MDENDIFQMNSFDLIGVKVVLIVKYMLLYRQRIVVIKGNKNQTNHHESIQMQSFSL